MTTLIELVIAGAKFECKKHHQHDDDYQRQSCIEDSVNNMSKYEFLEAVSEAMEQLHEHT